MTVFFKPTSAARLCNGIESTVSLLKRVWTGCDIWHRKNRFVFALLCVFGVSLANASNLTAFAQQSSEISQEVPVFLQADEVTYDDDISLVSARGNVEIAYGERILLAHQVSLNRQTETVTASGDIKIIEPTGEVFFAEYLELSNELQDGVISQIRILLEDNARLAANGARRSGGRITELSRGVYTACELCREDPTKSPIWQVKAQRVIHDQQERQIEYHDATLEFFGLPVAYTPYFSHSDPSVDRETGFITPRFGSNSDLGYHIRTPFFWALSDSHDVTFDPILMTDGGFISAAEYRQHFGNGEIRLGGSVRFADLKLSDTTATLENGNDFRGHIDAEGQFHLNDQWRAGFDINHSTDQDYLSDFSFFENPGNTNISNLYAEGFNQRNYIAANAYVFQDLRTGIRPDEPLILPDLYYQGYGETDQIGGRWRITSNFRGLEQSDRANSVRASNDAQYAVPYVTPFGLKTTLTGSFRSDIYVTNHNRNFDDSGRPTEDGLAFRLSPRAALDLSYPFIRPDATGSTIIEPIAAAIIAPNGGNPAEISNDDSTVVEIDETNIFEFDALPGLDRVEGGPRIAYGMRVTRNFNNGGAISLLAAQRQRLSEDADLQAETGLVRGKSDIVGRLDVKPTEYFDIFYRARFDEDEERLNRSELQASLGSSALGVTGAYTFLRSGTANQAPQLDEVTLSAYGQWDDYWRGSISTSRNLDTDESLSHGLSMTYEDECLIFSAKYTRTFNGTESVEPTDDLLFTITLKTLTTVETGVF